MIVLILVTISTDVTRKSVHPQHCKMEGWHSWTAVEIKEEQDNEEGGESEMKLLSLFRPITAQKGVSVECLKLGNLHCFLQECIHLPFGQVHLPAHVRCPAQI